VCSTGLNLGLSQSELTLASPPADISPASVVRVLWHPKINQVRIEQTAHFQLINKVFTLDRFSPAQQTAQSTSSTRPSPLSRV
jgi:hypothetical protein